MQKYLNEFSGSNPFTYTRKIKKKIKRAPW